MDSRIGSLAVFLATVVLAAVLAAGPEAGDWYLYLPKPAWSLPAWGFAIAWPLFYLLMALAAWWLWLAMGAVDWPALAGWVLVLALVVAWFWVLFGQHRPGWGLAAATLLGGAALFAWMRFRGCSAEAANALTPCLVWLAYLWLWNLAVWRLAGGGWATVFG